MALNGLHFTVQLIDHDMRTTTRRFQLGSVADEAAAKASIANFVTLLKAVTLCGVTKATLLLPVTITPTAGAEGSNVDAGATVSGWITLYQKKATIKWPDPDATARAGDGSIDLADEGVAAFLAQFLTTDNKCLVSDTEMLIDGGLIKGKLDR
jgi:hypothetical protein